MEEMVQAVTQHALDHYNDGGWDVIVECYGPEDIATMLVEADPAPTTPEAAIAVVAESVSIWAERQADAFHSAF